MWVFGFKAQINWSVRMRAFLTLEEGAISVREWVNKNTKEEKSAVASV